MNKSLYLCLLSGLLTASCAHKNDADTTPAPTGVYTDEGGTAYAMTGLKAVARPGYMASGAYPVPLQAVEVSGTLPSGEQVAVNYNVRTSDLVAAPASWYAVEPAIWKGAASTTARGFVRYPSLSQGTIAKVAAAPDLVSGHFSGPLLPAANPAAPAPQVVSLEFTNVLFTDLR